MRLLRGALLAPVVPGWVVFGQVAVAGSWWWWWRGAVLRGSSLGFGDVGAVGNLARSGRVS